MSAHPNREAWTLFAYGFLSAEESSTLKKHLIDCPACRAGWEAAAMERDALKMAFAPAPVRLRSWWPFAAGAAAGLAAAAMLAAVWGADTFPASSAPPDKTRAHRTASYVELIPCEGAETNFNGYTGTGRQTAGRAVYELEIGSTLEVAAGRIVLVSHTEGTRLEIAMRPEIKGGLAAVVTVAVAAGMVALRDGNAETVLNAGDVAAVTPEGSTVVVRNGEDPQARRKVLEARIAELQALLARPALPVVEDTSAAASARRLAAKLAAIVKREGLGKATTRELEELLGSTLARIYALPEGADPHELQYSPRRDLFLAAWVEARGHPLSAGQRSAVEALISEEDAFWAEYLSRQETRTFMEREAAGMRELFGRNAKLDAILTDGQRGAAEEVQDLFLPKNQTGNWWLQVADVDEGVASALLEVRGAAIPKVELVMRDYVERCLAIDDGFPENRNAAGAPDNEEEKLRVLELRAATARRLIDDFGLTPEKADLCMRLVPGFGRKHGK